VIPTKIRSRVWEPSLHKYYPESFRKSCKEILLCSRAPELQPPPEVMKEQINAAAQLPRALWVEVLSYTHRDWFAKPRSEEFFLRQRLEEERQAATRAHEARLDAETRLRLVERERDAYRRLALRWQSRLQSVTRNRDGTAAAARGEDADEDDDVDDDDNSVFARAGGLNAIIRQFQEEAGSSDDDDDDDTQGEEDAERDAMDAEESDDADGGELNVAMEDAETESDSESTMAASPPESVSSPVFLRQARTVSVASHGA